MDFDSIPEKGSTFIFTFKLTDAEQQEHKDEELESYACNKDTLLFEWQPQLNNNIMLYKPNIRYVYDLNKPPNTSNQ